MNMNDIKQFKVVLLGAGNLATSLGLALVKSGFCVEQVYSRTLEAAQTLANVLNASAVSSLEELSNSADVYFLALKDDALPGVIQQVCRLNPHAVYAHTAGSVPMSVFNNLAVNHGVLYPLQTFSKQKPLVFNTIPCLIEGANAFSQDILWRIAHALSNNVHLASSEDRRVMHLAAVFGCNFVNLCYTLANETLKSRGLDFELLLPLIDETAAKVHRMTPLEAQTGPAVRKDKKVMQGQMQLIDDADRRRLYELMSEMIHKLANK